MHTTSLREFVETVPVCATTASLDVVLSLFRQTQFEWLLLVDEHHAPVGVFNFRNLLPYLLTSPSQRDELPATLNPPSASFDLTQFPIEPIGTLSLDWQPSQVVARLQTSQSSPQENCASIHWVLVDASGACLGLLNQLKFWQQYLTNPASLLPEQTIEPPLLETPQAETPELETPELETPPLEALKSALSPTLTSHFQVQLFSQLVQVLEQLPIPIMLQTGDGRVIGQNLAWRQQIGELKDLPTVQREATLLLETSSGGSETNTSLESFMDASDLYGDRSNPLSSTTLPRLSDLSPTPAPYSSGVSVQSSQPPTSSVCHSGTNSDTCVCICSMKNGQERVWQFVKIPLRLAPDHTTIDWSNSTTGDRFLTIPPFHLASLASNLGVDGSLVDLSAIATANTLWLVQAQDTTEQQQVAKELAAKNADLIQLNRLKDEFLACISHELKTPLTSILGLSSLLKDQLLGPLNERQARYTQLIYQGGRHLILIVNDILDLTRIETGQLELIPEPVNIELVCHRAFEQARHLLLAADNGSTDHQTELKLETQFSLDIDPNLNTLIADELRLRQMLANLLSNALKFTEIGGDIGLRVSFWEGWIAFTVWDTGIGIPANKQHLIFQKFQQLENPLTRRFEGTGLGLVLTQRLARLHGGDVTFTSVEGQGSEFTLLLPPSPPTPQGIRPASKAIAFPPVALSKRLVMVVEAVPRFLEDLTQQLTGLGCRVAIARSGTEALEKIRRLQPAIVFLNPVLPLLSGWDVLTLLKSDSETRHIPVVVTATRVEKSQAYSNGANSFLSLPIQPNALQHSLEYWMERPSQEEVSEPQNTLTVLHLRPIVEDGDTLGDSDPDPYKPVITDLSNLLHPYHCRVLEVDDLEQADLLARVWKPDLILLDGTMANPVHYLIQLSQSPFLAALPLVTLTSEMTQAANQVPDLAVFPCLATLNSDSLESGQSDVLALWQVMQIAVGTHWTSHILIADLATLPLDLMAGGDGIGAVGAADEAIAQLASNQKVNEWLQVLLQYIQTAKFRASLGQSWSDVLHQIQHGGVDLLLLCVHATQLERVQPAIEALAQLESKPPILVWDCSSQSLVDPSLLASLGAIATRVIPVSLSMQDLLEEIQRTLNVR
ncbi:hybrid sensor histidine kinase/response regulator [Oscillatoria sp. FACHB-1407]|uniref:hybrid sensor histidine kinase/response regulator n=1 Tax=Oscillatoria sp. FACHB-1407 TaxID=2692847 RepID=UPI0016884733|nr:hybrid sensor histidine kinase/response regulator [Oscillatoria sp. FACHB-1407]MBD2461771.1 hybrid sensor histidine kinase/response regulator [Oscillatoria sp. FACHB-1407]